MKYQTLANQFSSTLKLPLFEIQIKGDNEYLIVDLSIKYKQSKTGTLYPVGVQFSFDQREPSAPYKELQCFFDGAIKGKHGNYVLPFDTCFSLDEHMQTVYDNIIEGFIMPNDLYFEDGE